MKKLYLSADVKLVMYLNKDFYTLSLRQVSVWSRSVVGFLVEGGDALVDDVAEVD
jgi:hypothetical protein